MNLGVSPAKFGGVTEYQRRYDNDNNIFVAENKLEALKLAKKKIKKIYDTWVFSRDTTSVNPNWQLVNTLT